MRIIDRYLLRESLAPVALGLLVFTFVLIVPFLIEQAEQLITKGVPAATIFRVLVTLLPSALGLTIPMSLLAGLLIALGRLSADREFVALQACGVSDLRLLRPIFGLAVVAWAATMYVMIVALPASNQSYRELTFSIVASRAEGEIRPRIFFREFPGVVLYVRDVPVSGGWQGVFMADQRPGQEPAVFVAEQGRVVIDRERQTVDVVLERGARHQAQPNGEYQVAAFSSTVIALDPLTVFPRSGPSPGEREMTIAQLRELAREYEAGGRSGASPLMEIQKKYSIPAACLVFGLLGLTFGATRRRDGKMASFVQGLALIFAYYVLLWLGQALARTGFLPAWLGVWAPNIILGGLALGSLVQRLTAVERPLQIPIPPGLRKVAAVKDAATSAGLASLGIPFVRLLDRYVVGNYLRVFLLATVGLSGLFYIVGFLDFSDELFRGDTSWQAVLTYFWFATPQYLYYIVPMGVLLATLATIGVLTRNSELVVMKASGISLYRVAAPLLATALLAGGALFVLGETALGPSNQQAEEIGRVIRGGVPGGFNLLTERWIAGRDGTVYHYQSFDSAAEQVLGLSIYEINGDSSALTRRVFTERATFQDDGDGASPMTNWVAEQGSEWRFQVDGTSPPTFTSFAIATLAFESPEYMAAEEPDPAFMGYSALRRYIDEVGASGADLVALRVAMARKLSFPFVALVMAVIAVPFAVTTGSRGALYGVGVGIILAMSYWVTISIFAAVGSGGLLSPTMAAWAPNVLFGAGAAYFVLSVRT